MKFLQTYRTSCPIGQSGSDGFQFYSFSDGITEAELDEISLLGSYKAPLGSDPNPTEDEVLNVLPVAFKYFRLSSGRVGVLQSTARTEEYTGRSGNYFTHALILEQGEFPFWPILMHHSRYLRHNLTEEEKNIRSVPPPLPKLTVKDSECLQNDFNVREFAGQNGNEDLLSKLLYLILSGKAKQRKGIILVDSNPEKVIYALSYALPFEKVQELTFSTYSQNPDKQNVLLSSCRSEGCAINLDDPVTKFDFFVFKRENGKYAPLENQTDFSKILAGMIVTDPHRINELYSFSNNFSGAKDDTSLDLIASIFSKKDFISKWDLILPFVTKNAKSDYVETFLNEYREQIMQLVHTLKDEEAVCKYLECLLVLINRLPDASAWLNEVYSLYLSIIVKRLDASTKSITSLNKRLLTVFKGHNREYFKRNIISRNAFSHLESSAHTEQSYLNVFALIVSSIKTFLDALNKMDGLFSMKEIVQIIDNIDEDRIPTESFQILIAEMPDEIDFMLLGILGVKANNLAKRFIRELMKEDSAVPFSRIVTKGFFDNPAITDDICEEVVCQLEKNALVQVPSDKDMLVYAKLKKWIKRADCSAINLILAGKDAAGLIEQMSEFKDMKKLSVFLEWKNKDIFPQLTRPEDWKKYYSLSQNISSDTLNSFVKKYFDQAKDPAPLVALIIFSHGKRKKQLDVLIRKIMATMKYSAYKTLKREMGKCPDEIMEYFTTLNKGIQLKRLFNFKF